MNLQYWLAVVLRRYRQRWLRCLFILQLGGVRISGAPSLWRLVGIKAAAGLQRGCREPEAFWDTVLSTEEQDQQLQMVWLETVHARTWGWGWEWGLGLTGRNAGLGRAGQGSSTCYLLGFCLGDALLSHIFPPAEAQTEEPSWGLGGALAAEERAAVSPSPMPRSFPSHL